MDARRVMPMIAVISLRRRNVFATAMAGIELPVPVSVAVAVAAAVIVVLMARMDMA